MVALRELESHLWESANILRGPVDASDFKTYIFPLLFYKRLCDVYDEERAKAIEEVGQDFPESHRFQIPADAHWDKTREVTSNVGQAIQSAMRAIEKANQDKLYGIFGDAQWTNKDRLSDAMLRDLIEHFSSLDLTIANLPEDELGNGYEYLIKKFADDSGHTAAEFYTNRTVVHLMTELLQPQPGESIYDPTCGSGGMLLSAIAHLRNQGKEWRNVKLYGQELNLMTSSIARMNCFLHGIEDFRIERGNTLSNPKFIEGGELQKFDVILANPPYSIKQWDRAAFENDPWGRNMWGTPPQGRADYAFQQHIIKSLSDRGRCAVLWPHGVLFRNEEQEMRRQMIEGDLVEAVIGLGPNLFYNSPMEACILVCNAKKPKNRAGKVLFINAVSLVVRERSFSYLARNHLDSIVSAYRDFSSESGFSEVASIEDVLSNDASLAIGRYMGSEANRRAGDQKLDLASAWQEFELARGDLSESWSKLGLGTASAVDFPIISINYPEIMQDSDNWPEVAFGDVVRNCTESTKGPSADGISKSIGLEHIVPGDIHVRSWKGTDEGSTFSRICRPGHVLFGKRRPYQRKIAVSEVDAVVSGDIYVFESKVAKLSPSYLPLVCRTDAFYQLAVETSAGSLSPRTNWKSLKGFRFRLPPVEVQNKLAQIHHHLDKYNEMLRNLIKSFEDARKARRLEDIEDAVEKYGTVELQKIASVNRGKFSHRPRNLPEFYGGPHPFAQTGDIAASNGKLDSYSYTLTDLGIQYSTLFPAGTVFITIAAVIGATAIATEPTYATDSVVGIVPKDGISSDFLQIALAEKKRHLESKAATQTAQKNINLQVLRPLKLPNAPLDVQAKIARTQNLLQNSADSVREAQDAIRNFWQAANNLSVEVAA